MTNSNTLSQCFSAPINHLIQILPSMLSQFRLVTGINVTNELNGLCTVNTIIVRTINNLYYCKHTMKGGEYIK